MAKSTIYKVSNKSVVAMRLEGKDLVSGRIWNNTFHLGDQLITSKRTHGSKYEENAMDMMESYYASGTKNAHFNGSFTYTETGMGLHPSPRGFPYGYINMM